MSTEDRLMPTEDPIDNASSRWDVLSRTFGLVRASGDLTRDLDEHKRIGLQRGFAVQSVKRVASESEGGEVFEFIASSGGDVKRDGNAVLNGPQNWTLDNFRMNPRFTWNHSYDTLPLGTVVDVRPEGSGQSAILRSFHRFSKRWDFAEIVKGMYIDGDLDCVSIGWTPLEYERILGSDGKPEGWRFTLNELLEIAAVVIPADPKARLVGIQRKLQRGLIPESFIEHLSLDKYLREISHGDIYVLDHRSPVTTNKREIMETNTELTPEPTVEQEATPSADVIEPAAVVEATPGAPVVDTVPPTESRAVRSEMSDAVDIELAKVSGLYESLEYEVKCLVDCGKMLPYASDGDAGLGRHLNVARALVTEIDSCLSAIGEVMSAAPPSMDPYQRPVVVEAPEDEGDGEMEMSGPEGETRVGKKISATRMAKLKDAMQYAADAYRCVRAVVADAADGELDGKIAEGEDKPMTVEPMDDPTLEQALDAEDVAVRAPADADDAARLRSSFASLVSTVGLQKKEVASVEEIRALAERATETARSAKAYADAIVGNLRSRS